MAKDYYEVLGVSKTANKEEIKKAFHKLAHQYHPDKKGGDEKRFKEVNEAYQVLSDEKKRAQYDQFGHAGAGGPGYGGFGGFDASGFQGFGGFEGVDLGDIFGDMFGGGFGGSRSRTRRGNDIEVAITLSFEESAFGVEKDISISHTIACERCRGSGGEPGSAIETCATCSGSGKISETRRTIFGTFATATVCPACNGDGKTPKEKCKNCSGKGVEKKKETIKVKVPAGIQDGEMLRMSGRGEAVQSGVSGDLYIRVSVRPHSMYHREGNDLVATLNIKLSDALLGATHQLKDLRGKNIDVKIPEGIRHGDILRLKEHGIQSQRGRRGDMLVHISIIMPKNLKGDAKRAAEELRRSGI